MNTVLLENIFMDEILDILMERFGRRCSISELEEVSELITNLVLEKIEEVED